MAKSYILVVDDEPTNQLIMEELFEDYPQYEVAVAKDGEECLEMVAQRVPDLVLMDVNMPKMSGYDACIKLRANPATAKVPVIFVSALTTADDRLTGYEAGGDDYITKPFNAEEVLRKSMLQLRHRQAQDNVQAALQTSNRFASEMRSIIEFVRETFGCNSPDELCDAAFECMRQFGLEGSILITCFEEPISFFSDGRERPLEHNVLEELNKRGGVITFGQRLSFNIPNTASLLVRNLPADPTHADRLKEHLSTLLDGLAARVIGLRQQRDVVSGHMELNALLQATQITLESINEQRSTHQAQAKNILDGLEGQIETLFLHLGLTEAQEEAISGLISQSQRGINELFEAQSRTEEQFTQVMETLRASLAKSV